MDECRRIWIGLRRRQSGGRLKNWRPPWTNPGFCRISQRAKENRSRSDALSHIAWRPAFAEALAPELRAYKNILEFHPERQLTAEPLRIGCVIVKKAKGAAIEKNIAAIFKGTNLLEYKSPGDYVSAKSFYKVLGRACPYTSLKDVPATDMTASFAGSRYPRKLIRHLESARGYAVAETHPGIYTAGGSVFPKQIVDARRLPEEENLWLRCLSDRLDTLAARKIIHEADLRGRGANMGAYLAAIFQANAAAILEAVKMTETAITFETMLEEVGLIAKWEARSEARVLDIAQNMVNLGLPYRDRCFRHEA